MARWIREETGIEAALDPRLAGSSMTRYTFVDEAITYINALADRHGADEFCVEARRPRILAAPVNSAAHTLQNPHLAAQKYWVDADQPGVGLLRRPGAPYQLSATPRG